MPVDLESFKGKIDFGIISIREDEFLAVLERFAPDRYAMGSQRYEIGTVGTNGGGHYTVAAVRCVEQGRGHAQKVATDLIRDLEPRWLLVVGIGGAVPSMDSTLGDVVCATRVHDFSVRAVKEGATDTYSAGGGPMHPEIQRLLASLPAIVRQDLGDWNSPEALSTPKPTLRVPGANSDRYYGDVKWKAELRRTLLHHFPEGHAPRPPLVTSGSVATSDALVKSTGLLNQWQEYARGVAAVEMELGGVFLAARQIDREYPILAIRGISDIVGFKREEQWTKYACTTAAAFAYALIRAGAAFEPRIAEMNGGSQALLEQAAPDGSPVGEVVWQPATDPAMPTESPLSVDDALRQLCDLLVQSISTEEEAKRIVRESGVASGVAWWTRDPASFWEAVLQRAHTAWQMEELFAAADKVFGGNPDWRDAKRNYLVARDAARRERSLRSVPDKELAPVDMTLNERRLQALDDAIKRVTPSIFRDPRISAQRLAAAKTALLAVDPLIDRLSITAENETRQPKRHELQQLDFILRNHRRAVTQKLTALDQVKSERAAIQLCSELAEEATGLITACAQAIRQVT